MLFSLKSYIQYNNTTTKQNRAANIRCEHQEVFLMRRINVYKSLSPMEGSPTIQSNLIFFFFWVKNKIEMTNATRYHSLEDKITKVNNVDHHHLASRIKMYSAKDQEKTITFTFRYYALLLSSYYNKNVKNIRSNG